jgi:RNA polymerase sigma-70 factor (ECF subfamily)
VEARAQLAVHDEALAARVARGDADALGALYDRYAREVFVLAAHALGRPDAEEVVQDVFVRLWQRAGQFDSTKGSFGAWFMTIARHCVVDRLKGARNAVAVAGAIEDVLASAADPAPAPDEAVWLGERRNAILDALKSLPYEQRLALLLAYFGGLTQSSIAEQLGWPLGTVKKRLRLGLQKVRASLTDESGVENREERTAPAQQRWPTRTTID